MKETLDNSTGMFKFPLNLSLIPEAQCVSLLLMGNKRGLRIFVYLQSSSAAHHQHLGRDDVLLLGTTEGAA